MNAIRTILKTKTVPLLAAAAGLAALSLCASQETLWRNGTYSAIFLYQDGRYDEGLAFANDALALARQTFGPNDLKLLQTLNALVSLQFAKGDYRASIPLSEEIIRITETNYGQDHPKLVAPLNSLAGIHVIMGNTDDARALYRRALDISEAAYGADDARLVPRLEALAVLDRNTGRLEDAFTGYGRIEGILKKCGRGTSPEMAGVLRYRAELRLLLNEPDHADPLFRKALAMFTGTGGRVSTDAAFCMNGIATILVDKREYDLAEPFCEEALDVYDSLISDLHMDLFPVLRNCGIVYDKLEKFPSAAGIYERMIPLGELMCRNDMTGLGNIIHRAGLLRTKLGMYDAAESLYKRALDVYRDAAGQRDMRLAVVYEDLADLYKRTGRERDMLAMEKKAYAIRSGAGDDGSGARTPAHPPRRPQRKTRQPVHRAVPADTMQHAAPAATPDTLPETASAAPAESTGSAETTTATAATSPAPIAPTPEPAAAIDTTITPAANDAAAAPADSTEKELPEAVPTTSTEIAPAIPDEPTLGPEAAPAAVTTTPAPGNPVQESTPETSVDTVIYEIPETTAPDTAADAPVDTSGND